MHRFRLIVLPGMTVGILLLLGALFVVHGTTADPHLFGHSLFNWWLRRCGEGGSISAHGPFIPLVSLVLLWLKRNAFLDAEKVPSLWGIIFVVMCLLLHLSALRMQLPRLSLIAFSGLCWSLILSFWGWTAARLAIFPAAYLVFSIPMAFLDALSFPLRMFSTHAAVILLNGLCIQTIRVGTVIRSSYSDGMIDYTESLRQLVEKEFIDLKTAYTYATNPDELKMAIKGIRSVSGGIIG